jgi:hypothetical protein
VTTLRVIGRLVLRGLQDLGRCHAMADWAVFVVDHEETDLPNNEEKAHVRYHGMGGFRA